MKHLLLATAAFCATSSPLHAEEADDIVVTGSALASTLSDAAYAITAIEIDRRNGVASGQLEDILKDVAGLTQFRRSDARSANATSQGATLRGLGGNASSRALLVLDGVPQSDPFGGWVTWPAYQTNRLSRAIVTRGGGSGAYGSGALAGTIELESIGPNDRAGLEGSLLYGSRDAVEANARLSGKLGQGFGLIAGSYARGDGFVPVVKSQRGLVDRASPYEQASVALRAVVPLSASTELQANALAFRDRRERGTALSDNGGDGGDASLRVVHRGRWGWSALGYIQARKFQSRFTAINAARTTVTQTVDQFNVPSTGLGARFELRPPVGEGLELRLGTDWRRTSGETRELFTYVAGLPTRGREAGGRAETLGGFAELSAKLGDFTLTGSGRADHWSLTNGHLIERTLAGGPLLRNELAPDRSDWEGTGRAGLAWSSGGFTLRSAAYLGWRLPTLNELYRPFRVGADATAANAALSPERIKGAEVGFRWHKPLHTSWIEVSNEGDHVPVSSGTRFAIAGTMFTNRLTDSIGNVTFATSTGAVFPGVGFVAAGGAYRQRLNLDAIRARGIEVDLEWRIAQFWNLNASYAYTDARVRSSGIALALNGLRPAQVPSHTANATIGWKGLSATVRYVSGQFEDDQNSRRLNDALTFDAVARVPISKRLALLVRGENLANTRVETAISGAGLVERASPRTIWVGLAFRSSGE